MSWIINAVLKDGVIYPLEPLPSEWTEGSELAIQLVYAPRKPEDLAKEEEEEKVLAAEFDHEDHQRLMAAIDEQRRQAKAMMRREMGIK